MGANAAHTPSHADDGGGPPPSSSGDGGRTMHPSDARDGGGRMSASASLSLSLSLSEEERREQERERAALAYLLRYEAMVRQQDAEDMATSAHLGPIWGRLAELGVSSVGEDGSRTSSAVIHAVSGDDVSPPQHTDEALSRRSLGRALDRLEAQQADSSDGVDEGGGGGAEAMTTDLQLMFLLRILVGDARGGGVDGGGRGEETGGSADSSFSEGGGGGSGNGDLLTFPEFSYAYKMVVGGMQCLQMLPSGQDAAASELRGRVTDRTTSMLRSFYEDGKERRNDSEPDGRINDAEVRAKAKVKAKTSSTRTSRSTRARKSDGKVDSVAKGELVGDGPPGDEMRRLLTVKDRQLVRILDDHCDEMDNVAGRIAVEDRRRGRRRAALAFSGAVVAALALVWGFGDRTTTTTMTRQGGGSAAPTPALPAPMSEADGKSSEQVGAMARQNQGGKGKSDSDGYEKEDADSVNQVPPKKLQNSFASSMPKQSAAASSMKRTAAFVNSAKMANARRTSARDFGWFLEDAVHSDLPENVRRRRVETRRHIVAGAAGVVAALLLPALGGVLAPLTVGLMGFGWIRTLLAKGDR